MQGNFSRQKRLINRILRPAPEAVSPEGGKIPVKIGMVFLVVVVSLALACPVLAQPGSGGGGGRGMGPGGGMGERIYNPQTVATVKGTVEKLEGLPSMGRGSAQGMQYQGLVLKTDQGSLLVHLGPVWYMREQKLALKAGDALEVTGSKVTLNDKPALIAREIKLADKTVKLRDDQGFPVWSGMGRGPGGGQGKGPAAK
jgi:hypothetical protein